jgi:hypothetical protein
MEKFMALTISLQLSITEAGHTNKKDYFHLQFTHQTNCRMNQLRPRETVCCHLTLA